MKTGTKIVLGIVGAAVAYQAFFTIKENIERHTHFNAALAFARLVDKPLLVVGLQRRFWEPPNGDVTVDIDPEVLTIEGGVLADVKNMPFTDKRFGAAYVAHILEHMETVLDVETAVNECMRIADRVYFLCPSPYGIISNFFCPSHYLRIWFDQASNTITVADNNYRISWIPKWNGQYENPVKQSLVIESQPEIYYLSK